MEALVALFVLSCLAAFFGLPFVLSWHICKGKNRNPWKGLVVTFFLGWLAPLGFWLSLKHRDPSTRALY